MPGGHGAYVVAEVERDHFVEGAFELHCLGDGLVDLGDGSGAKPVSPARFSSTLRIRAQNLADVP